MFGTDEMDTEHLVQEEPAETPAAQDLSYSDIRTALFSKQRPTAEDRARLKRQRKQARAEKKAQHKQQETEDAVLARQADDTT